MGLLALAAFFLFQASNPVHTQECFDWCSGTYMPAQGSLKVFNLTNNHIRILLIPVDENGHGDSFIVLSPLQYPQQSIAVKLMVEGEYICIAYLISSADKNKQKYAYGEMVKIDYNKQAEVRVVSNDFY